MNVTESFKDWMESAGYGTFGQDLWISRAPASPAEIWWLKQAGGESTPLVTGGYRSTTTIQVNFRSADPEVVYNTLTELRNDVDQGNVSLSGYELIRAQTNGPFIDEDLDDQERETGMLEVTLNTYQGGE